MIELVSNPYFSAGFGLLGVGTGLAVLKQGLVHVNDYLRRRYLMKLEISSKDKSFNWMLNWITAKAAKDTQHLSVQTIFKQHDNGSSTSQFVLIPCPGVHYMKYHSRWFKVQRERDTAIMDLATGTPFETLTLTTFGRDKRILQTLLTEAQDIALKKQEGKTVIYSSWANEWRPFGLPRRKRPFDSVVLDGNMASEIFSDVSEFLRNGSWYFDRGIPYRRGYLLHGPPVILF